MKTHNRAHGNKFCTVLSRYIFLAGIREQELLVAE